MDNIDKYYNFSAYTRIPTCMISDEVAGIYGNALLKELNEIIRYYDIYENGAPFIPDANEDIAPIQYRSKIAQKLINKEARFMFATTPDVLIDTPVINTGIDVAEVARQQSILQTYVDNVLKANKFSRKLIPAAKDCFIGKRIAWVVNFSEDTNKIVISFIPSLGFVATYTDDDSETLEKLIIFYCIQDGKTKEEQRIYRKRYYMENERCVIDEGIFDGGGDLIEDYGTIRTPFEYIPGGVIINDGLTGDISGVSEIAELMESESWYNKMESSDMDSERKSMNSIFYTVDADPDTTAKIKNRPGAYWDLATDDNAENKTATVGLLEPNMSYSTPLANTLNRIRAELYEQVDMPDTSSSALQGIVTSGKTLKAIYWSLMVRCDEKFASWRVAFEHMVKTIIDGGKFYPAIASTYAKENLPDIEYEVIIENNYPIQDDQTEEKEMDLAEVQQGTMSKKAYMQKWRKLSDDEAEKELQQMAIERQYEDTAYFPVNSVLQQKEKEEI